jgi:hypothetical protein
MSRSFFLGTVPLNRREVCISSNFFRNASESGRSVRVSPATDHHAGRGWLPVARSGEHDRRRPSDEVDPAICDDRTRPGLETTVNRGIPPGAEAIRAAKGHTSPVHRAPTSGNNRHFFRLS